LAFLPPLFLAGRSLKILTGYSCEYPINLFLVNI
jgi:hypothetical protein